MGVPPESRQIPDSGFRRNHATIFPTAGMSYVAPVKLYSIPDIPANSILVAVLHCQNVSGHLFEIVLWLLIVRTFIVQYPVEQQHSKPLLLVLAAAPTTTTYQSTRKMVRRCCLWLVLLVLVVDCCVLLGAVAVAVVCCLLFCWFCGWLLLIGAVYCPLLLVQAGPCFLMSSLSPSFFLTYPLILLLLLLLVTVFSGHC